MWTNVNKITKKGIHCNSSPSLIIPTVIFKNTEYRYYCYVPTHIYMFSCFSSVHVYTTLYERSLIRHASLKLWQPLQVCAVLGFHRKCRRAQDSTHRTLELLSNWSPLAGRIMSKTHFKHEPILLLLLFLSTRALFVMPRIITITI